jgi:hypothetical protein
MIDPVLMKMFLRASYTFKRGAAGNSQVRSCGALLSDATDKPLQHAPAGGPIATADRFHYVGFNPADAWRRTDSQGVADSSMTGNGITVTERSQNVRWYHERRREA